jgi:iron complex outermembrane receptor protein
LSYFKQKYERESWAWLPSINFLAGLLGVDNTVTTSATFGAINYRITDRVKISLEGRYQEDEIDNGTSNGGVKLVKTFPNFMPRVILQFQPTDATNLYATYSVGNKPGDFNEGVADLTEDEKQQVVDQTGGSDFVPEEELDNFEIGWKQRLFDNRASFNIAAYYNKWKNQQTKVPVILYNPDHPNANPITGTRPIEILVAAGKTDLWGVELDATARVAEGLDVGLTFGWAASEYKEFTCGFVARFTGSTDCAGNSSPRFPEYSGSINGSYVRPLTATWTGFLRGDVVYFGKAYVDESNLAWTDDYTTVNLHVGAETDTLRLDLWARNLFDEEFYVAGARGTDFTNGFNFNEQGVIVTPDMGRQIGITATLKF